MREFGRISESSEKSKSNIETSLIEEADRINQFPNLANIEQHLSYYTYTITIDLTKMQALKNDVPVKLSAMEYKLLELLIRNRGQVLTRDLILERLWDCDGNFVDENTLRVLIRRLRQKIETDPKNPKFIVTVFGIGYTFGEAQLSKQIGYFLLP